MQLLENTKGRESVLGTYDIDENGDTTLTDYGLYEIEDGQLEFVKEIKAAGRLSPRHRSLIGYVSQRISGTGLGPSPPLTP